MNQLIPNKQCMLLFVSFSSYICLPYPPAYNMFLAQVYTLKLERKLLRYM